MDAKAAHSPEARPTWRGISELLLASFVAEQKMRFPLEDAADFAAADTGRWRSGWIAPRNDADERRGARSITLMAGVGGKEGKSRTEVVALVWLLDS